MRFIPTLMLAYLTLPVQALDLQQAYQLSLQNDPTLRAAQAAAAAGRERLPQARAQLLPNLSASLGTFANRLDSSNGDAPYVETRYPSHNETLTLRQPIYRPALTAGYRQARAQEQEAEARLQQALGQLSVRVSQAYFDVLLAQDQQALVKLQLENYGIQLDAARQAQSAGVGTRTDVDEAQARLDLALAEDLQASQQLDFTRQQIEALIYPPSTPLQYLGDLQRLDIQRLPPLPPEPLAVSAWIDQAESHSPELQSLRAQMVAASEDVARARSGHLPTLDVIGQIQRSKSENVLNVDSRYRRASLGLQLNVPLFAAGLVSSTVCEALAEQERLAHATEALRRDLALRVRKEHRGVSEGLARIKALEQAALSADQLVRSNRRSLQAGSRTLVDVFNAEQQRMVVLRDLAQERYQYLLSRIRLQALVGQASEALVSEVSGYLTR